MRVSLQMANDTVHNGQFASVWSCRSAEDASSAASSASSKDFLEDIGILAVIEPELKLREVQREIGLADVVVGADDTALQQAPEPFDAVRVDFAAHVLASAVADGFVFISQGVQMSE